MVGAFVRMSMYNISKVRHATLEKTTCASFCDISVFFLLKYILEQVVVIAIEYFLFPIRFPIFVHASVFGIIGCALIVATLSDQCHSPLLVLHKNKNVS